MSFEIPPNINRWHNMENAEEDGLSKAIAYIDEHAEDWDLNIDDFVAAEPLDQAAKQLSLLDFFDSEITGDSHMQSNLSHVWTKSIYGGVVGLDINFGSASNVNTTEPLEDINRPNAMIIGILDMTGAVLCRSYAVRDNSALSLYKGEFCGRPVYFEEVYHIDKDGELSRQFMVMSRDFAQDSLVALSSYERNLLEGIDLYRDDLRQLGGIDYLNVDRSNMPEIVRMYQQMQGS